MPRLFVAVELPDDVKDQLHKLRVNIPTARWVKPEQMHLTLRFIGADVPQDEVQSIIDALAQVDVSSFDLTLRGVGRFPDNERRGARVLWVGIQQQPVLHDLHRQVESALRTVGIEPEARGFSPHLTLARLRAYKTPGEVPDWLRKRADFRVEPFRVDRFVLFSSVLSPQGPTYTEVAVYPLRA